MGFALRFAISIARQTYFFEGLRFMARDNCFYHNDIVHIKGLIWKKAACLPGFLQINSVLISGFASTVERFECRRSGACLPLLKLSRLLTKPWLLVGSGSRFEFVFFSLPSGVSIFLPFTANSYRSLIPASNLGVKRSLLRVWSLDAESLALL